MACGQSKEELAKREQAIKDSTKNFEDVKFKKYMDSIEVYKADTLSYMDTKINLIKNGLYTEAQLRGLSMAQMDSISDYSVKEIDRKMAEEMKK